MPDKLRFHSASVLNSLRPPERLRGTEERTSLAEPPGEDLAEQTSIPYEA